MVDVATPSAAGLRFPVEDDEKYKARIMFIAKGGSSAGFCSLYFPEAVSFADGLVYDNANLGVAGEIARRSAAGLSTSGIEGVNANINNTVKSINAPTLEDATSAMDTLGNGTAIQNLIKAGGPITSLAVQSITETIGQEIGAGVAAGSAVTANPHKRSIFRDVALRTFTFSFLMTPMSQAESQSIENIVDFFRANAYPDRIAGGLGYKFPTQFKIEFLYDGKKMSQAPKLLPCYLTSVDTTLNPRSSSFFKDGRANEVQLTMSFQEVRALDKKDVEGGY